MPKKAASKTTATQAGRTLGKAIAKTYGVPARKPASKAGKAPVAKKAARKAAAKKAPAKKAPAKKAVTKKPAVAPPRSIRRAAPARKTARKKDAAKSRSPLPPPASPALIVVPSWLGVGNPLAALEAAIKPRRPKQLQVGPAAKKKKKTAAKPVVLVRTRPAKKVRASKAAPQGPAKKSPSRRTGLKKVVKALKAALKVKKPPGPVVEQVLRPDYGEGMRGNKDAERLLGVSRQVH